MPIIYEPPGLRAFSVVAVIVMKDNIEFKNVLGQLTRHNNITKGKNAVYQN